MTQVNIISGVYTDSGADYRAAYPVNFYVVPEETGLSKAYLRPADGIAAWGVGKGVDRGAIGWNGACYRVQGSTLVSIDSAGVVSSLGGVGGSGPVTMDYSFDNLIIQSGISLFYYNKTAGLRQVTDDDLIKCISARWFAGYTVFTDGEYVAVTELNDPMAVNPLKYGSSEADPDKITGLERIRNELYVLNRNTIEVFQNIGGNGFPFQRVDGAQLMRGNLGSRTYCIFDEKLAFVGGARNEAVGVYVAVPGEAKISTREIDKILAGYSESVLSACTVEARIFDDQKLLYIHLPDKTLLYDLMASQRAGQHIWTILSSGLADFAQYRGINFVYAYGKWICGDPASSSFGYLDSSVSTHYGAVIGWWLNTQILWNNSAGAIVHRLELIGSTGRTAFGTDPTIWTSYSIDGIQYSQERPIKAGKWGETSKRLVWMQQGYMRQIRTQRFRGNSDSHISFSRLDAEIEGLNV